MFPSIFLGLPDRDRDRDRDSALPFLSPVSSLGSADLERDRRGLRDRDRDLKQNKIKSNRSNQKKKKKWMKIQNMDKNPKMNGNPKNG